MGRRDFPVHKGFHAGVGDAKVLDALDELEELTGESTSAVMKRSIRMYLAVEEVIEEQELEMPEPSKRHFVRQAVRNELVREYMDD